MPSVSGKQHRLMEMVAHNPSAAKRLGIKQSVGRDFVNADKNEGKTFSAKQDGRYIKKRKKHKLDPHNMSHAEFLKL